MATPVIDWTQVADKVRTQPWAKAIVDSLDKAFDKTAAEWPGDPTLERSEWTHHYFCDDDAARLTFDITKPTEHVCSKCGRVYAGEPWNGAWRTTLHNLLAANVERAGILARLQPDTKKYVDYIRRIVIFYAEHYADYPVHGDRAGKGKIMPQCLDEAILLIKLGEVLQWGKGAAWFTPEQDARIAEQLYKPSIDLLRPQIRIIHNIHAWMQGAIATAAIQCDDRVLLDWSINSEFGWRNQLEKGCNEDGFWYEGSITYHFYTFSAFTSLALRAAEQGIDLFGVPKYQRMLKAPLMLAFRDGVLPAHNDCWPGVRLTPSLYELATWAWPASGFQDDLSWILRIGAKVERRTSTNALLYGPAHVEPRDPPAPKSHHFKASGIAILQNDRIRVCLRSGPDGGGHDHHDKLNIDVRAGSAKNPWDAADLGTSGYGATITGKWYRTPAAHCSVVVDEKKQKGCDGVIERFTDRQAIGVADTAYDGVCMRRTISLTENGWNDVFNVDADAEHTLDWFFHGDGALTVSVGTQPIDKLGKQPGYDWPREPKRGASDAEWTATWTAPAGVMRVRFKALPGTEIFTAIGDANPKGDPIGVLMVRRRTKQTTFDAAFSFDPRSS